MKRLYPAIAISALFIAFALPVYAQTATTANPAMLADHTMRASMIIGATVYNEQGQSIGTVVDVLVKDTAAEPTAILSVGDFVGGGTKLIAAPLSHVNLKGPKAVMAGTKEQIMTMPAFKFMPYEGHG
jgi:hypothetical protein